MLTKRQKTILEFVRKFIETNRYAPSFEEIKKHFKLSSVSTVHHHIHNLEKEGYIKRGQNEPRSISIETNKELVDIPLIGTIAAGQPIEAIEIPETIKLPKSQLSRTGEHYALKVRGNSMIDEGIYNDDVVVVKKQSIADNGTTVVALVNNNEVTLKKIYKEKNQFRLQPANPDIKPIFTRDLIIQGKVISVIRNFGETKTESLKKEVVKNKKLNIPFKKTCQCFSNHINCLTAKQWMRNQVAIWEFSYEKRDIRDKNIHPAVFPVALPAKCIELFTHKGELVLDPFSGIGTTLLAAKDLDRNAVGFDLSQKYTDFTKKRLAQSPLFSTSIQIAVCDDALNIPDYFEENSVSLVVTSPPYANMLNRARKNKSMRGDMRVNEHFRKVQQYSNNPRDLGTMEPRRFADAIGEIYAKILPLLKPRGHCVINITDLWWNNKRFPLHIYVTEALEKAGYELRNTIIWDRRNLVNRIGIFGWPSNYITLGTTMEYILDFWRPSK